MCSEITRELFYSIVDTNTKNIGVKCAELYRKTFYIVHGVKLMILDNFTSNTTQYYIIDINA